MSNTIQAGSVVKLNSGGPFMTVAAVVNAKPGDSIMYYENECVAQSTATYAKCLWFVKDYDYRSAIFNTSMLHEVGISKAEDSTDAYKGGQQ